MLGARLRRCRHGQDLPRFITLRRYDIRDRESAFGYRPGLVENHGIHGMQTFEGRCRFDQDSPALRLAGCDDDSGRRGKTEGAGTGNDQNGDGIEKREVKAGAGPITYQTTKVRMATRTTIGTNTPAILSAKR